MIVDLRPDHLEIVKRILAERVPEYQVRAFGSRARWTAKDTSDLDMVVMTDAPLGLARLADLQEAFSESDLPFRVDVLDWAATGVEFREITEQDYAVIQQPGSTGSSGPTWRRLGMGGEWPQVPVSTVCHIRIGGTPKRSEPSYWGGLIKWASAAGVANCYTRYLHTTAETITEEGLQESAAKLMGRDTVVITARGTVGALCMLAEPMAFNQTCYGLVAHDGMVPGYLYYALKSTLSQIRSLSYGTVFDTITMKSFDSLRIPLPSLEEQQAIACILGTLDDKIELNRRTNETLEGIARAIFESWFVDFDPVRAKAAGQQPPGLAPHIADLFPDEFEESPLGLIPAGWRVDTILTIGELLSGGTPSTKVPEYWNGNIKWVSAKDVRAAQDMFVLDTERTITQEGVDNSSTKILPERTTIVTARGTVGSYCILAEPMAMNQTNYGLKAISENADYFVFFALGSLVSQLKQRAYGTIFDTVTTRTFETSQIVVPGDAVITKFDQHIRPLMEKIRQSLRQSRTLAALRDTLLPKLISGELRVPDAEKFCMEVGL